MDEKRDKYGRFKPGVSGNPGGKPKGPNLVTTARKFLREGNRQEEIIKVIYSQVVAKNDIRAARLLFDFLERKPAQRTELAHDVLGTEEMHELFTILGEIFQDAPERLQKFEQFLEAVEEEDDDE